MNDPIIRFTSDDLTIRTTPDAERGPFIGVYIDRPDWEDIRALSPGWLVIKWESVGLTIPWLEGKTARESVEAWKEGLRREG